MSDTPEETEATEPNPANYQTQTEAEQAAGVAAGAEATEDEE